MGRITLGSAMRAQMQSAQIEAVVLNADGTVKRNLGVISYWHRNPLKRLAWAIKQRFSRSTA